MSSEYSRMDVLDHGYVILVDKMGDDLKVANAARVSFGRRTTALRPQDERLIAYLARHGHTSPFRHNILTFEVHAPLLVARQLQRYVIGGEHSDPLGAWSEMSYRYVTKGLEFYIPGKDAWRMQAKDKKQGSSGHVPANVGAEASLLLKAQADAALDMYNWAIEQGIAGEQARLFLPAFSLYTTWWMTLSLQALGWLIFERMQPDAMYETSQYATALLGLTRQHYPRAFDALMLEHYKAAVIQKEDPDVRDDLSQNLP